ncbi:MAG TPA: D-aminoacylase [Candidatus Limnocylindrales bacterium]|nr:D-aminoacylase [Candidatus Limnocylindrales bacterium]
MATGPDASKVRARRTIAAEGLVVAPGFIDLHTHVDFTIPAYPRALAMVRQGVTTLVAGNCGSTPFPVRPDHRRELREATAFHGDVLDWEWEDASGYLATLDRASLACNVALLVGHGATRIAVMGFERRAPRAAELEEMRGLVAGAFEAGVFGLSSGLSYAPACYAAADEVVALAEVAHRFGGFYATHVRNEADGLIEAVREAIAIGAEARVPVEISHLKVLERRNWGQVEQALELIDQARASGQDVRADQYPYDASSTTLLTTVPRWALADGVEGLQARLAEPAVRARLREEILGTSPSVQRGAYDFLPQNILLGHVPDGPDADLEGQRLSEAARTRGAEPVDLLLDLLARNGGLIETVTDGRIAEDDVRRVMSHPMVAVASDGWTLDPSAGGRPHPRSYGTFVRVLGRYVRDAQLLSLEAAVRKMSALPASLLGLSDRGLLRRGAKADLVVFDPSTVRDDATYEDPHRFAVGIRAVIVNGQVVIDDGVDTGVPAGTVLRHVRPSGRRR